MSACNGGYHDMSGMAFTDAAAQINRHRPHILVNLDGWTSAPLINEIVILTPAPVQVNLRNHIRKPENTHDCTYEHACGRPRTHKITCEGHTYGHSHPRNWFIV